MTTNTFFKLQKLSLPGLSDHPLAQWFLEAVL